jgi:hypothetical protein
MIVPQYWAEGRVQYRKQGQQVTVRRFGWSDTSQADAQANADARAQEALQRVLSGEKLLRREPKIPYNGAAGVPIREEIVSRHGETIITRNAYGARCLNTPNVLFADVDFKFDPSCRLTLVVFLLLLLLAVALGWYSASTLVGAVLAVVALLASGTMARLFHRTLQRAKGGAEHAARNRISRFVERHPEWNVRVYRTPAGLRVLATHRTFQPGEPAVAECFDALDTDPIYVRMCLNQQCFRARVSPKPWRIGIGRHLRPRPGVWPVAPEHMPMRVGWITEYEAAARGFAASEWIESIGSGITHPEVRIVQELHDEFCGATRRLPLA